MKKLYILLAFVSFSYGDWKESASSWNKFDADKLLDEKYKQYNPVLRSDVNGAIDTANGLLDKASNINDITSKFGLDFGGELNGAQSVLDMVNNSNYQKLLMDTGLQILGGADSALLGVCYEKTTDSSFPNFKMPDLKIDSCIKFDVGFDGSDACGLLPEIPGYKKKSQMILEIDQRNVQLFCNGWSDIIQIEKTTPAEKIIEGDGSKAISETSKIAESPEVTEKIKRTNIANVAEMSGFRYQTKEKDQNGNNIKDQFGQDKIKIVQPLKGLETQDTQDKKNAHKYVKKILEKEALQGKTTEDIEYTKKITLSNLGKANVAYKNEHEYVLAREEAISKLHFLEDGVFDTKNEVLLFTTKVQEHENSGDDVTTKVGNIKGEKDNILLQYKQRVAKWLKIKEAYYFEYEKKGIATPTAYYIHTTTENLSENEKYIKRSSLVYQVEKEMNQDAQYISMLRIQANQLINEFERKLDIEIIANRKFDIENAMKSVGL